LIPENFPRTVGEELTISLDVAFDTTSERGATVLANTSIGTYGRTEPAPTPRLIEHDGVLVVRDDLFPGGTKARLLGALFNGADEVVYASPAEGSAQTALAIVARRLGKRATIFVARRAKPHPRTMEAAKLGAQVISIAPGYLSVVQARAREYCNRTGARLMPFGADMPEVACGRRTSREVYAAL
jgi:hypothetical protein